MLSHFRTLPRTTSLALSFDLGRLRDSTCSSSHQLVREISSTPRPQPSTARIARLTRVAHISLVPHVSLVAPVSELQVRELLRFSCGQVALVLDEQLFETVGDMLVDLANRPFTLLD